MICNECQHDTREHRLYGCNAGAEDEAEKAAALDWLSEKLITGKCDLVLTVTRKLRIFNADQSCYWDGGTLFEAVAKAMEGEQ